MLWETELERLKLLSEVIAEQNQRGCGFAKPPEPFVKRRNFASHIRPSKPLPPRRPKPVRDTKPLPPSPEAAPPRRRPRNDPDRQPSAADLAIARWLSRPSRSGGGNA